MRRLFDLVLARAAPVLPLLGMALILSCGGQLPPVSICATGEVLTQQGCVCKPGHVRDTDGRGCHVEGSSSTTTSTTTTTSSTSTTTTTTLPPVPTPPTPTPPTPRPTPEPTPSPCVAVPMPAEPVSVRGAGAAGWHRFDGLAFAPSACGTPGENLRCFRDRAAGSGSGSGAEILWPQDETACWALGPHTERELRNGARHPVTRYGKTMVCPVPNYPDAGVGSLPHCWDAWGRRVDDAGGAWILDSYPEDRFTGWYHGLCPPATMPACPQPSPTPRPTPGPPLKACSLPAMPESGANGRDCDGRPIDSRETGIYGCCRMVEDHGAWAGPSQFADALEAVLDEMVKDRGDVVYPPNQPGEVNERLEDAFMADLVGRLRARGLCATRGGPSDEVGIKGENGRSEQFDVVLSEGKVRRRGYVAVCRPARF